MRPIPLLLLVFTGCRGDVGVVQTQNLQPWATINAPAADAVFFEGAVVEFLGTIADYNGLDDIQTVVWTSTLDGPLGVAGDVMPDANGHTRVVAMLTRGTHIIELTATDKGGLSHADARSITVTSEQQEPVVEIIRPDPFDEFLATEAIHLVGVVHDDQQDADSLWAAWTSQPASGGPVVELWSGAPAANGTVTTDWVDATSDNWLLTLSVLDDDGNDAEAQVYVIVTDPNEWDEDGDGFTPYEGDCDDGDYTVNPGADEICGNGRDNDCSGLEDDKDVDGDGHIDEDCTGYVGPDPVDDCDDEDGEVYPGQLDEPDLDYLDTNCDDIDGDLLASVFLDPVGGSDSDDGLSPGQAVGTLDEAYAIAATEGLEWVLIADGPVSSSGFEQGVHLAGGYDAAADWLRDPALLPQFSAPSTGRVLEGWSVPTRWQQIAITAASATASGGASIALRLVHSTGLTLSGCQVSSGDTVDGRDGTDGADGNPGRDGADGQDGCEDSSSIFCDECSRPKGGGGGYGGATCEAYRGGGGGKPGKGAGSGDSGSAGIGSAGGSGGSGATHDHDGSGGSPGGSGSDGTNGSGGGAVGVFGAFGYQPANGSAGTSGSHGSGGGGGGGGGGGDSFCDSWGGAGGGGGGAGCGGVSGTGGTGAGASAAIVLVDSAMTLEWCVVATGNAGDGGNGGTGGDGGAGGNAGDGGDGEDDSGRGGSGSTGGAGGDGGHGGGGGGGPVVGIVCESGSTVVLDTTTVFDLGAAGAGGSSAGKDGVDGLETDTSGC